MRGWESECTRYVHVATHLATCMILVCLYAHVMYASSFGFCLTSEWPDTHGLLPQPCQRVLPQPCQRMYLYTHMSPMATFHPRIFLPSATWSCCMAHTDEGMCTCMCARVCMHVFVYVHVFIYACVRVCVYLCIYVPRGCGTPHVC
jgi:hypothetical protein